MTDTQGANDIVRIVEDNTDPKTFDLLAFTRAREVVRDKLRLYFDEDAMYHIAQFVNQNGDDGLEDAPEEIQTLIARNLENSILLHLEAPDPVTTEDRHAALLEEFTDEDGVIDEDAAHEARGLDDLRFTLVRAEQPDGAKFEGTFTRDEAREFITRLPAGESARLAKRLGEMSISSLVLSNRTDADFLPRA